MLAGLRRTWIVMDILVLSAAYVPIARRVTGSAGFLGGRARWAFIGMRRRRKFFRTQSSVSVSCSSLHAPIRIRARLHGPQADSVRCGRVGTRRRDGLGSNTTHKRRPVAFRVLPLPEA